MSKGKLFIGQKVRSLREATKATQAQFSARLGISASYLNQIENNQRPVSAAVLVALAEKFQLNMAELVTGESERLLSALSEALADPLFERYEPSLQELKLVTQNAPGMAHALIRAHQAYRQNSEQLAHIDDSLGKGSGKIPEVTSYEEVRDFFHFVDNYIGPVDIRAEQLADDLKLGEADVYQKLVEYLKHSYGIRVVRNEKTGSEIRRYDRESRVLTISSLAAAPTQTFQVALQIARLLMPTEIAKIIKKANFRTEEAGEICRIGLNNYFAAALLLPYKRFHSAAAELRHDVELLSARFGASLEQVAHRLSTLQRPGLKGVPIFFARIDRAGNITKRHSATKLQFARFGAACPLWNVHQAFESPGRIIRQLAQTPDGVRYLSIATQIEKGQPGFNIARPRHAITLGCEISYARDFVYADGLDVENKASFEPIGISCRVCERIDCAQRAVPPLKRRLLIDHDARGLLPYQIVDY